MPRDPGANSITHSAGTRHVACSLPHVICVGGVRENSGGKDPWSWLVQTLASVYTAEPGPPAGTLSDLHGVAECKVGRALEGVCAPDPHHWAAAPPKHPGWKSILVLSEQENKMKGGAFWDWRKGHMMDSRAFYSLKGLDFLQLCSLLEYWGCRLNGHLKWNVQKKHPSGLLAVTRMGFVQLSITLSGLRGTPRLIGLPTAPALSEDPSVWLWDLFTPCWPGWSLCPFLSPGPGFQPHRGSDTNTQGSSENLDLRNTRFGPTFNTHFWSSLMINRVWGHSQPMVFPSFITFSFWWASVATHSFTQQTFSKGLLFERFKCHILREVYHNFPKNNESLPLCLSMTLCTYPWLFLLHMLQWYLTAPLSPVGPSCSCLRGGPVIFSFLPSVPGTLWILIDEQ